MKLRKGFIAAATAAAMVTGGMAAAPAQAEPTVQVLAADAGTQTDKGDKGAPSADLSSKLGGLDGASLTNAGKIITIISGVIGLIASIAGIVTKYFMK